MIVLGEVLHATVKNNGQQRRKVDFCAGSEVLLLLKRPHEQQ